MADYYTVKQGDYLSRIAKENGFTDYSLIWDHPNNADLKKQRQNPNVLLPGDEVFIPDMEQKQESGAADQRHSFVVDRKILELLVVLEDMYEKPIAGVQCDLLVDGHIYKVTTDSNGMLRQEIPLDAKDGALTIHGDQTPLVDFPVYLKIGDLDPVAELSGQIARLSNLGYFPGDGSDDDAFESAVEEFQCDHGLKVTGDCDSATQSKLQKVHGC